MPAVLKIFWIQEKPAYKSFFIFQNISKTTNVLKNHGQCFFKLHDALDIYKKKKKKKSETSDYVYFIWSWSRFRFFYVKSWFLCNTNRDCFCHINDVMLIFLFSNKLDENKALARTFIRGLSETFTKTLRLNVLTLLSVAYCT